MALFTIDSHACKRDGHCVAECPMYIIEQVDKDAVPIPTQRADELCINCGHCVAVCPHGAFSLATMPAQAREPLSKQRALADGQLVQLLKGRRSVRNFKDEPLDRDALADLLDLARYAPSGKNKQPVRWIVLEQPATVQKVAGMVIDWARYMLTEQPAIAKAEGLGGIVALWDAGRDVICHRAPHVVMAYGHAKDRRAMPACTLALSYVELAAHARGLGACWAGYLNYVANNYPPLTKLLELPQGHQIFGSMVVGMPKYRFHRIPDRNESHVLWK